MNAADQSGDLLATVLRPLSVRTIVCIDDVYMEAGELPIEAVLTVVAGGLSDDEQRARIQDVFPGVEFGDPFDEDWRLAVREAWREAAHSDREHMGRLLSEITGSVIEADRKSVSQLRSLTQALPDVELVELSPADWLEKSNTILAAASADARILCLFDQDLQNAGLGADGGFELIEGVIRENQPLGVPNVICGLLSHTFKKEDEEDKWREMARSNRLNLSQVLPISKERLESPEDFAGGVARAIINLGQERMKDSIARITQSAQGRAMEELRNVSVWDFDHIVLKSSAKEGVWEAETLFRLFKLFERKVRRSLLFKGDERTELDSFVRKIQDAQASLPVGEQVPEGSRVWELRHSELFLDKEINEQLLPIELGDLFLSENGFSVLLAQPCDLMLRGEDGARRASVATLVPIESKEKPKGGGRHPYKDDGPIFYPKCPYFPVQDDGMYWLFNFRKAAEVSLDVLDLASFREDGICKVDVSIGAVDGLFHPSRLRYKTLHDLFVERDEVMQLGWQMAKKSKQAPAERDRILEQLLSGFSVEKGILTPKYKDGIFEFGLRRVGRYLLPSAADLLAWFESSRARPAHEHDFAGFDN